ncbi:hypothetical protein KIW84_061432 [Lathyrus oleraceus]|uniref:Uncharacterized protein n=1 Tax=Pisum sativum TaxID=3888 RepID=A0A9D4W323_PEA|nr:hypothetical protein KIW84_061432 [Pisum sativum]
MPNYGCEDPRWSRKEDLYHPSHSRKLDIPLWAFLCTDELVDCCGTVSRPIQSEFVSARGVKGNVHSVVRINSCVVKDQESLVSEEARRVDILSVRISLAHRILTGTKVYTEVHKIVETALELLEIEAGPLDHVYARMIHGIVSRLSCGAEVQKLCSTAVECFDLKLSELFSSCEEKKEAPTCSLHFEECLPTSVVIVLEYKDKLLKNFLGCRL